MGRSPSKRRAIISLLDFFIRRPLWPLLAVGLVTGALAAHLPKLSFSTTVSALIIEDLPATGRYNAFLDQFGSDEIIRLVVEAENIFEPAAWLKVSDLSAAAAALPGVRRVISLPEVKKRIDTGKETSLGQFKALLDAATLFRRNLVAEDGTTTILTLVIDSGAQKETVIKAARELIASAGTDLNVYQTGIPLVLESLAGYTEQDFRRLTPVTLAVIALVLLVLFRNPHCLILPLGSVILSCLWTFGLMAWTGTPVSMLTIIVPVFLIAVGTAYCLHLCSAFLKAAQSAGSSKAAVLKTFESQTFPVFLAIATTVLGIGSLAVNRISAIQEFALFASFGMASLLVILLSFFPAVLALLPLPAGGSLGDRFIDQWMARFIDAVVSVNTVHQRRMFCIIGAGAIFLVAGALQVRVETNPVSFFKKSTPVSQHFHDIYQKMSGSFPVNVVVSGPSEDYFEDADNMARIAKFQQFLNQLPGVDKTVSVADYLQLVNYAYNRFDPAHYTLPLDPYELRMLMNHFKILLGSDLLQRFMSTDYRQANILMLTHIASSRDLLRTRDAIFAHARKTFPGDLSWDVTGLGMVIAQSSHLLTLGQVKSLTLSLGLVFAVMVALFLSSKVGVIAIVPNLFPILVNFGLMGWLQIPLSAATALIASVVIGLAVDDTIHYLVRYNLEFKKDLDKDRAMRDTLREVGRPIVFTSATIGLGFAVLVFSHFQPTAVFGLLMMVTMAAALVGDLILLPSLLLHVELVTAWDLLRLMPNQGGMSPAMAHELNQPLNAIKVGNEFLKLLMKKGEAVEKKHLATVTREIGKQVDRASAMIHRLSEIGQVPGFEKSLIDVNRPVRGTLSVVDSQLRLDNIELKLDLADNLPRVLAHHNRLVQVMFNLIDNSREAIRKNPGKGTLAIRTFVRGDRVGIEVADSGTGVSDSIRDRVFEPFFTTKERGRGKGLGLTICRQIVRDCNGNIELKSPAGGATTATLLFPAAEP